MHEAPGSGPVLRLTVWARYLVRVREPPTLRQADG
jgi:hypothetical protein